MQKLNISFLQDLRLSAPVARISQYNCCRCEDCIVETDTSRRDKEPETRRGKFALDVEH